MENVPDDSPVTRPPDTHALLDICRKLNAQGASYIVMGGMVVNIHGFIRATEDIDFLVETSFENEGKLTP